MLKKLLISIFLFTLIVSCDKDYSTKKTGNDSSTDKGIPTLENFKRAGVGLIAGKSITTGNTIVANTKTGEIEEPCGKLKFPNPEYPDQEQEQSIKAKTSECEVELVDKNPEIIKLFEATLNDFTTKLKINGEIVDVQANIVGHFTWKGSCNFGTTSGGDFVVYGGNCDFICKLLPPGTQGC